MKEHYLGIGHVAVYTENMAESIAFYEKIGGALQQQGALQTPDGEKKLALVAFAGFVIELIQAPTPMPMEEGNVPHFAVYVDDLDAIVEQMRAAGVNTFIGEHKSVNKTLFGGLQNYFFRGPSGETIELLQMFS